MPHLDLGLRPDIRLDSKEEEGYPDRISTSVMPSVENPYLALPVVKGSPHPTPSLSLSLGLPSAPDRF